MKARVRPVRESGILPYQFLRRRTAGTAKDNGIPGTFDAEDQSDAVRQLWQKESQAPVFTGDTGIEERHSLHGASEGAGKRSIEQRHWLQCDGADPRRQRAGPRRHGIGGIFAVKKLLSQSFAGDRMRKSEFINTGSGSPCPIYRPCRWPNCTFGRY